MAKYSNYIELNPQYESVVDIDSDSRNPGMWQKYIVHEDMEATIEAVCDSLKYEDADKRRSFWIHGAYGTGKSYAAIVLKHLFEDNIGKVKKFLSNQFLIQYRDRFLSLREKGDFLVIWQSQATDIRSGLQLLMAMEAAVRDGLNAKFGNAAYYGKNSLITAAQDAVNDTSINWAELFKSPVYRLYEEYGNVDDFRNDVADGKLHAIKRVAKIYRDKGWGFFNSLTKFKDWLTDIIEGNALQDTGIIFIWDEFTSYLRNNPNDDVLQPLAEFCKQQPFFMFLIVHRATGWVNQLGEEVYERIIHRYHSLDFHVSESAAYKLIGSSILTRAGMEEQWEIQRNILMKSIDSSIGDFDTFDNLAIAEVKARLRRLCPLHPMTLSLLTIVAQNFGASQRTLFRFMKDPKESAQNVGFIYYINHYGSEDWYWLTADFLWDYFFMRESDVRTFSAEAKSAYQHYVANIEQVKDANLMHVFKAAMLLIAVMYSGTVSNLYSQAAQRKFAATVSTLYKCFIGKLTKEEIDDALTNLEKINVLRFDDIANGDKRLQIPYSGNVDSFNNRKEILKAKYTRHEFFKKNGTFAASLEGKIWDRNGASFGRMIIAACNVETNSIKVRLNELQAELGRYPYKFGVLVITVSESNQFVAAQDKVKKFAAQDKTGRMAVYLLKYPLTDDTLDRWYNAVTHSELAAEEGKSSDSERYTDEAAAVVEEWSTAAVNDQLTVVFGDKFYPSEYNATRFAAKLEQDIIFGRVFTAAPELFVSTATAFKKLQKSAVEAGIQKSNPNAQIGNVVNGLEQVGVWQVDGLEKIARCGGNAGAEAVASVANFLLQRFSQGTQINLDVLWQDLQESPYGYCNNIACGYVLGFLLRHYVNSEFTWNRGDNNPWPLTEKTLATMITSMCKGELVNNYLSPGSEVWRKFKPYVQNIFKLSDGQAVNETEARKYISKQCTEKVGVPFWVLKYLPAEKFGDAEVKALADEIIDLFCDFMLENGDQDRVMENITVKFTGRGALRKTLTKLYFDRKTTYGAFGIFMSLKCSELQKWRDAVGLTEQDLFDAIHQFMQGQVSDWTERQVEEKIFELCPEYRAVMALNDALNVNRKNLKALANDMANVFDNMKVPVAVIKKLGYNWLPTLAVMEQIITGQWSKSTVNSRENAARLLTDNAQRVWDLITAPKPILQQYLVKNKIECTNEELLEIYHLLRPVRYNFPLAEFDLQIEEHLGKIAYNRNKDKIQALWLKQSGFKSVAQWCNNFVVPIQWVVTDEEFSHISVLKMIEDGKRANLTLLQNAVSFLEERTITTLKDEADIAEKFITQVGENYRKAFAENRDLLIAGLKANPKLSDNVYSWANKIGEIRETIDKILHEKYCLQAVDNVMRMRKSELQNRVVQLLKKYPDLYTVFI